MIKIFIFPGDEFNEFKLNVTENIFKKIKEIPFQFIYHNKNHFFGVRKMWIDRYNNWNMLKNFNRRLSLNVLDFCWKYLK